MVSLSWLYLDVVDHTPIKYLYYEAVKVSLVGFSSIVNLFSLIRHYYILLMGVRHFIVIFVVRALINYCRVYILGLYAMVTILSQLIYFSRVEHPGLAMIVEFLVTLLESFIGAESLRIGNSDS